MYLMHNMSHMKDLLVVYKMHFKSLVMYLNKTDMDEFKSDLFVLSHSPLEPMVMIVLYAH